MKKKIRGLCAFILAAAILFSITGCELIDKLNAEEETTTAAPNKTELTEDKSVLVSYFNSALDNAYAVNPGITISRNFDVKDIKFFEKGKAGEEDAGKDFDVLNTAMSQAVKYMLTDTKNVEFDPDKTEYGKGIRPILYDISVDDLAAIDSVKFEIKDDSKDTYRITLNLTELDNYPMPEGSLMAKLFKAIDVDNILTEFEKSESYLIAGKKEDIKIVFKECNIYFEADRLSDQIKNITLTKNAFVTAPMKAVGSLEKYGEVDLTLKFVDTTKFSFDWVDPEATTEATTKK